MDLTQIPEDVLQAEVERRAKLIPDQVAEPDWSKVLSMCDGYLKDLAERGREPRDFEHYLYEAVMTTCYGPNIFSEWVNKRL